MTSKPMTYDDEMTPKQKSWFIYNFHGDFADYMKLITKGMASEFIGEIRDSVEANGTDVLSRQRAKNELARRFKLKLKPSCPVCAKRYEPINDVNSCSC